MVFSSKGRVNYIFHFIVYKMKNKYIIIYLLIILVVAFIISVNPLEHFEIKENIDCYVITLGKPEKMKNIENQQQKIPYQIQIVDAIFGDDLNLSELVNNGTLSLYYSSESKPERKRQIGCYMSHLKVLDKIIENNTDTKYSIIFEDDFNISDNFMTQLNENLEFIDTLDFDVLFLGTMLDGWIGKPVGKSIYTINEVYGTHGYLVKNAKVSHIKECMKVVDNNIDLKYTSIPELKIYIMYPSVVHQLRSEFKSDIS
jgi:GR25 family glycosyltransferase involved in LPS biosynthesis